MSSHRTAAQTEFAATATAIAKQLVADDPNLSPARAIRLASEWLAKRVADLGSDDLLEELAS